MAGDPTAEQKEFYDAWWRATAQNTRLPQHLLNRIFAVQRVLEKGIGEVKQAKILEVGCGLGYLSAELSKYGQVDGVDLSPTAIEIAQQIHPGVNFFQGDVLSIEASDYDIVVASEVIEHIKLDSRDRFAAVLWKALKPDGWLILTTPNRRISHQLTNFQPVENHFTESELRDFLLDRFEIVNFGSTQTFLPVYCHRYRLFQAIRIFLYEALKLRPWLEDPYRCKTNGLYFVVLARRRS